MNVTALAKEIALRHTTNTDDEYGLVEAFIRICQFIAQHPDRLSKQIYAMDADFFEKTAKYYFNAYRKIDIPKKSSTIPDAMIDIIMGKIYGYSKNEIEFIKKTHQYTMGIENCIGNLLERYIDSVLRKHNWSWCCGSIVKATDFIYFDGIIWHEIQIKNRDNSENSSSSAIRYGTTIDKWFRSFSKKTETNWHNLPNIMQNYGLSEAGFTSFVEIYLTKHL